MKKNNIHIEKKFHTDLPLVLISVHAITHVFLNIIKNAMDAMEKSGTVIITTSYSNGKVQIVIADTGEGIDSDLQKNIFDPYFTTKSSGSGIGLTIAYKLVQLHGGDISLDASYKNGASFIIQLPAYADEQRLLANK